MAHAAPPPPGRQRRNAIIGAVVLVVGLVCAVVAIIGLRNPKGPDANAGATRSTTITNSATPSSATPSSTSPTPSSSRPSSTRPTSTRPSTSASRTSSTPSGASSIPLYIANNTDTTGLAALAESRFQAKGWKVSGVTNYSNGDIISTCAYWDANVPGSEAAAEELQQQFPNILRVKQRFDGLPDAPIVVVLNPDYS